MSPVESLARHINKHFEMTNIEWDDLHSTQRQYYMLVAENFFNDSGLPVALEDGKEDILVDEIAQLLTDAQETGVFENLEDTQDQARFLIGFIRRGGQ